MEKFIKQAFTLFEQIGSTTSRTSKEAYLEEGRDNPVFKELLFKCYNQFMMFYVKKAPKVTQSQSRLMEANYMKFDSLLIDLNMRIFTGNEALDKLDYVFSGMNETELKWYTKVLQKDLKIGITESTINKVFGKDFIPTFTCMLAEKLNKYPKRFVTNPKMDGYRLCGFVYDDGSVEGKSRNGKPIEGYNGIEEALAELPAGFMYDGEIMDRDGTFNGTQKSAFKKVTGKDGVLHIFDMVDIDEFKSGNFTMPYKRRLQMLSTLRSQIEASPYLTLVPYKEYSGTTEGIDEIVTAEHDQFVMQGFEGLMVKDLDAIYKPDKGRAIQKVKKFHTIDLTVVDVSEGKEGTELEGTLGALIVELSDRDILEQLEDGMPYVKSGTFRVNVGSGFKKLPKHEFNRDVLWARKEDLINRTIEIKCFGSTINDDGGHSLRFPIFKKFRDDK